MWYSIYFFQKSIRKTPGMTTIALGNLATQAKLVNNPAKASGNQPLSFALVLSTSLIARIRTNAKIIKMSNFHKNDNWRLLVKIFLQSFFKRNNESGRIKNPARVINNIIAQTTEDLTNPANPIKKPKTGQYSLAQ